jgi:hypothetical protein
MCARDQRVGIDVPVDFDRAGKVGEGIAFQAERLNAIPFGFNKRSPGAAKWIEYCVISIQPKVLQVIPHEMRWERKHKTIPVMDDMVRFLQLVYLTAGSIDAVPCWLPRLKTW